MGWKHEEQCDGCNKTLRCVEECNWLFMSLEYPGYHHPPGYCPIPEDLYGGRKCYHWSKRWRTCKLINPKLNCPKALPNDDEYDWSVNFNSNFDDYGPIDEDGDAI